MSARTILIGAVLVVAVAACGGTEASRQVVVSAASSLVDVFGAIERSFEEAHPDVDVVLNVGASSTLREQILAGAPVDVYASADLANMAAVADAGLVEGRSVVFARNRLQIAVPAGNPARVEGLADLDRAELLLGVCDPAVPCGVLAEQVFAAAGLEPSVDTWEPNVRALLTKLRDGELDAGVVYVTDVVAASGEVEGIDIPVAVTTSYPIAVLTGASEPDLARAFVEWVLSDEGRAVLDRFGFEVP